jgi:membrane fusion protein (multidrug efflux system)
MKGKFLLAVGLVVVVVGSLVGIKTLQFRTMMAQPYVVPPETIASAVATERAWQVTLNAIGSITPVQGVTLATELAGVVKEIAFTSGANVAKGDLLLRFDTSSEEAQFRAAEAQVELARLTADRVRKLRADNTLSQAELDAAEATLKQLQASADAIRATIEKKTIRAPFAGRLGIRQVNLGEFLEAGRPIVSLQSLTPIYVEFSLPQQELAQLQPGLQVRLTADTFPEREFTGQLSAINPDLDPATRSVRVQATLDNAEQLLRPGMFARVEIALTARESALVIPITSVLSAPFGDSVFVIEPKPADTNGPAGQVVRQQCIRTGRVRGDFVSVESGLKAGDKVVSAGQFKLRSGMRVQENNALTPAASEKPRPSDG